jgi:hypothetical protein
MILLELNIYKKQILSPKQLKKINLKPLNNNLKNESKLSLTFSQT